MPGLRWTGCWPCADPGNLLAVNPLRRKSVVEPEDYQDAESTASAAGKGRPTPKRRTKSAPPVPAPRTRKEAVAWQKSTRKASSGRANMSTTQYKAAMKSGDPRVLPRREQGPVRALARDYVDSHRMVSNYLLLLFVVFLLGYVFQPLEYITIAVFLVIFIEWFIVGGRIRKLAIERDLPIKEGAMTLGFYAGSRAYFPRKWRRPAPRVKFGDKI
jgi:hypothetical protein